MKSSHFQASRIFACTCIAVVVVACRLLLAGNILGPRILEWTTDQIYVFFSTLDFQGYLYIVVRSLTAKTRNNVINEFFFSEIERLIVILVLMNKEALLF